MNKSLIQSDAARAARKQLVERNREQRKHLEMLQSLGLVRSKSLSNYSNILVQNSKILI
jgi:hypothetical protein